MHLGKYGPFADVVAIASALVATFSILLLKMLGRMNRWTWLTSGAPSFLVTAAARVLAIGLMAVTYLLIDKANCRWFAGAAVLSGIVGFTSIMSFDRLRKLHIATISQVGPNGKPLRDKHSNEIQENVVVGLESDMLPAATKALAAARKQRGGLPVLQFMAGYGAQRVNNPQALWDPSLLAEISNKLTVKLMFIALSAVMALFWAAFAIQASGISGNAP